MSIENKEIKISLRMMWTFAFALVFGTATLIGFYFGLSSQITDIKNSGDNKNGLQDLQIATLSLNVEKLEIELKELQKANNDKPNELFKKQN